MTTKEKIQALREEMKNKSIDAFIVFNADPHMSEYLPKQWQERPWLSGFTGSAGFVVITQEKAGLWTDSRYFVQAPIELKDSGIELFKQGVSGVPTHTQWLLEELPSKSIVAVNAKATAHAEWQKLQKELAQKEIQVKDNPLLDKLWKNREKDDSDPIFVHPLEYAGQSVAEKIKQIRQKMVEKYATTHIITALDDVAWTTNLRGNDVACNPVFLAYIIIDKERIRLFVEQEKLIQEVVNHLQESGVEIEEYNNFYTALEKIKKEKVWVSPTSNQAIFKILEPNNELVIAPAPGNWLKAVKNEAELEGFRKVMVRDGVALVKFFHWLEKNAGEIEMDEYSIGERLKAFRAEGDNFVGVSFGSIVGYKGNGAIVHYSAKKETCKKVTNDGSILIDSGGQYKEGTTDITRTIALGEVSEQFKHDWTLVLKGMIDLSLAKFPQGTRGTHLDILARYPLWQENKNYGHGTGHGVGSFMNVHEGPQNIRPDLNDVALVPGMVVSNEPGIYIENQYGIRIENLVAVQKKATSEFGDFYSFETLTLFPIFTNVLKAEMLTEAEKTWLNNYHQQVELALKPHLEGEEKSYLIDKCKPI